MFTAAATIAHATALECEASHRRRRPVRNTPRRPVLVPHGQAAAKHTRQEAAGTVREEDAATRLLTNAGQSQLLVHPHRKHPLRILAEFFRSDLDRLLCGSGLDCSEPFGRRVREVDTPGRERLTSICVDHADAASLQTGHSPQA
jgi:hypothetical protein